ncbi:hypothetical protein CDD80_1757 [Ophiocordyceps camponoti-rufipedis]|uniref:gamma-glutamylcyclotransferase n=1 Tax=Ophiocordyceps camponoti-rufipedis TaxID=2004952 RepID=A0A2C5Z8H6_9HYPO|nr:hypothetical protein CDD80_1757 [Ophiocordyceps camponoti-rufipedis]
MTSPRRYLAYGSNLHLEQMAQRCPNSTYLGLGILADYRWQINQRGYANIVAAKDHHIQGLVYEIDAADEARLDVNEGVAKKAYQKRLLPVFLRCAASNLYRRPVAWVVSNGGPKVLLGDSQQAWEPPTLEFDVLVYLSLDQVCDSEPKSEYVRRMNLGIADARVLGVDEDYIRDSIRPFIPRTDPARKDTAVSRDNHLKE